MHDNPPLNLFVYGTLMFEEVLLALLDAVLPSAPASISGYSRVAIQRGEGLAKGPVIFPSEGSVVNGRVLINVGPDAKRVIDKFEDAASGYQLTEVCATLDDGEKVTAFTYVGTEELTPLISGDWTAEEFRRDFLDHYLTERIPKLRNMWGEQ